MSEWQYEIKNYTLVMEEKTEVDWGCTRSELDECTDDDCMLYVVDEEVHRLHALIQKTERDIYKLRKWQKLLKERMK